MVKSIGTSFKPGAHLNPAGTLPLSSFINPDFFICKVRIIIPHRVGGGLILVKCT